MNPEQDDRVRTISQRKLVFPPLFALKGLLPNVGTCRLFAVHLFSLSGVFFDGYFWESVVSAAKALTSKSTLGK
jgi:hypothetical protein